MKIRRDFVTNSSSSSFIIGKEGDKTTVDTVYSLICEFYNTMYENVANLKKDCKQYGVYYDEKNQNFKFCDEYNLNVNKEIEKKYNIGIFDYIPTKDEVAWLSCKTYSEYVDYWKNKRAKASNRDDVEAPFYIVDLSKDMAYQSITYSYGCESEEIDIQDSRDIEGVIDWYIPCAGCYFDNSEQFECFGKSDCDFDCDYCIFKQGSKECKELRKKLVNGELVKENVILNILGKVCIFSECGHIPYYVVNELGKISRVYCNHMG